MKSVVHTLVAFRFVEDVLSGEQHANLLSTVNDVQFNWYFLNDYNHSKAESDDVTKFGFKHCFIHENEGQSNFTHLVLPIVFAMQDVVQKELIDIVSVHANMTINVGIQHGGHPHTDQINRPISADEQIYTAVYYLESCDGDTVFFAEDEKTITHRQTPKENTMVVFQREATHSAMLPMVSARRRIINLNIVVAR